MLAFRAILTPSWWIHTVIALLHIVTLAASFVYFNGVYLAVLIFILLISWIFAHYKNSSYYRNFIKYIEVRYDGQVVIYLPYYDKYCNAYPLSGSLASSYLLIIIWQLDDGSIIRQSIFKDMSTHDSYRRLFIWLRCDGVCK